MEETIFQKIVKKEIPSATVYEDANFLALLDINPVSKGHVLLITKEPYRWMTDVPDESISEIFVEAKKIMLAQIKSLGCDFVQVGVVGKDVPHFHIHLIPRMLEDTHEELHARYKYEDGEAQMYADKIKSAL